MHLGADSSVLAYVGLLSPLERVPHLETQGLEWGGSLEEETLSRTVSVCRGRKGPDGLAPAGLEVAGGDVMGGDREGAGRDSSAAQARPPPPIPSTQGSADASGKPGRGGHHHEGRA